MLVGRFGFFKRYPLSMEGFRATIVMQAARESRSYSEIKTMTESNIVVTSNSYRNCETTSSPKIRL